MTRRHGLARVLLVAMCSIGTGCAGSPTSTRSPDPTSAGTAPATAGPTATAVASASPAAESPASSFWRAASELPAGRGELVSFGGGYIWSGFEREMYFSPDGHEWQTTVLPWTIAKSNGVDMDARGWWLAASGSRVVAVGYADRKPCASTSGDGGPAPCDRRPIAWVTENGIDWLANAPGDILVDPFPYQEFVSIWPVAGGWDAALGQRSLILPDYSALAHSTDGIHWSALPPVPGSATGKAPAEHVDGVGTPDGQRIIWTFDEADNMVRFSRQEGSRWSVLTDLGPEVSITESLGPTSAGQPWLIGGLSWGQDTPRLWVSFDGRTFREAVLPGGSELQAGIRSLVAWDGGYLALAGDGHRPAAVWSSVDGETWTPEPGMTQGWPYLQRLIVTPAGLAAVHGSGPDGEHPVTFLLHD